ncbi:hypothetical protein [Algoriphagus confluentis]|uniref:GLPGLI family protein n=1 Tax=Algoriphagus confluentis TaxID=1697556 RepID=A0ABQ6PUD0_9BACT|nr:hypothetical protein Aconfl_41770 [Algoriphagus confluentis]
MCKFRNISRILGFVILLIAPSAYTLGRVNDTVYITPKEVNTAVLKQGVHRYLVYFKMGEQATRTQSQFWTREISPVVYRGRASIQITQEWEDKDSVLHVVKSIADAETFQPFYHYTWWKVQASRNSPEKIVTETEVDFLENSVQVNGKYLSDTVSDQRLNAVWKAFKSSQGEYFLNWHLDLETFPILPYRSGVTFGIPYYDPGTGSVLKHVFYKVSGSDTLTGYDGQLIDCWVLVHESPGNKETFYISKQTREVLKLVQEFGKNMFRYKIKFAFSE